LVILAALFGTAALASGQVSGLIGLVTCLAVLIGLSGRWKELLGASSLVALASLPLLVPVINERLGGLDPATGLPRQWTGDAGRWTNLTEYIWPQIFSGFNWLFGVRTAARIPSPYPWREWIWIESGYTWALWAGGIPLLVACVCFLIYASKGAVLVAHSYGGVSSAIGAATLAGVAQLGVLMVLDPHITMRGSADLLFALVGVTATLSSPRLRVGFPIQPTIASSQSGRHRHRDEVTAGMT
jgi:hypothetical protein